MRRQVISLLAVVLLAFVSTSLPRAQTPDSAEHMLEAARQMELIDGDLDAAIEQYEEIVSRHPERRAIVAQALLRMGSAYEKLGQVRSAREEYERLVRHYPDQVEAVAAAQTRLEPPASPMTVRELRRTNDGQPGGQAGFVVSADGQLFVYVDYNGDLARWNRATGEVHRFFDTNWGKGEWFQSPVFSPDEARVAFVRYYASGDAGGTRIEVSGLGGQNREVVYDFKENEGATYDWSPDGTTILVAANAPDNTKFLGTVDIERKSLRRLLTLDWQFPQRAEYSPDGRFIAYDSTKDGASKIYLISPDGAQERVLVESSGDNDSPTWTRDGRFLLFRSDRSGQWDLYALPMQDGQAAGRATLVMSLGEMTQILGITTEDQLFYSDFVDGRDIGITDRVDETTETAPPRLLPKVGTTEISFPSFSPDGQRLAYVAGPPGAKKTVRVTDLQGTVLREIPLDGRGTISPKFSPDGRRLACQGYDRGERVVMVLSVDTETVVKAFSPYEGGPVRILGWTADGRNLLGFNRFGPSLDTIDVEGERVIHSIPLSPELSPMSLSPSGKHLLMSGGGRHVLRSLTDGRERQLGVGLSRPVWDFDSRHVFFQKMNDEGTWHNPPLYSVSLDTGEETLLVEDMQDFTLAAVSPDGKYWALQNWGAGRDQRTMVLENFLPKSPAPIASQGNSR